MENKTVDKQEMGTLSTRNLPVGLRKVIEHIDANTVKRKEIYNPESKENLNERRIFGGNSDGMINFTRMKYQWALNLWDTMEGNTWFPKEISMTADNKDYLYLSPVEKRMYDLVLAQLIFMDSLQANNLMDNINPYISAPEVNACLSRQSYEECLVGDTEVLTPDGWLKLSLLTIDHEILQVDLNQKSSFVKPSRIIEKEFDGNMIHFSGIGMSQIVTPKHRMMYRDRNGLNKERLAEEFHLGTVAHGFPISTYKEGKRKLTLYERFLIALQADGTILREDLEKGTNLTRNGKNSGNISCTFTFTKERKITRLLDILDLLRLDYTITHLTDKNKTTIVVKVPTDKLLSKNFKDWVDLKTVTTEFALDFIDELKNWDGWDYGHPSYGYDTTVPDNMDIVQAIATMSGIKSMRSIYVSKRGYKDLHRITFKIGYDYIARGTIQTELLPFKGKVYCPTVDTGFFLIRHNNKTSITGNCNHSKSYAVMVESISDNTDLIYDMWKTDIMLRAKNDYIAAVYKELTGDVTSEKILLALFANQILEGIYFYAGFAAIYSLGKSGKMLGSSQMIRFIQRDEITHLLLFQNMINSTRKERPELFTPALEAKVREMFRNAVRLESEWGAYITQGQVLGFTDKIIEQYIQHLADKRLEAVGYKPEYNVKHPIPWVDGYASFNEQRGNFFESSVINYSKGSIDFDDF